MRTEIHTYPFNPLFIIPLCVRRLNTRDKAFLEGTCMYKVATQFIIANMLFTTMSTAVLSADLPQSKQTGLGLYLTAQEAADFVTENSQAVFVDVRTPEEIDKTGLATGTDALIPLVLSTTNKKMGLNPDFLPGMIAMILKRGVSQSDPIVIICRSGNRSATAANLMASLGFDNVYTVTDGYEGDRAPTGPTKGQRTINGWKNAGLPWTQRSAKSCSPARTGGDC